MKPRFFEGAAGTGKTTRLMAALEAAILQAPLDEHQRVLALSKMHGSRRRLTARLGEVKALRRRFDCMTVDSFARHLVTRWRALGEHRFGAMTSASFESWCARAGLLLTLPIVQRWVASTYPIVLVDEIQDSKGGQMQILLGLGEAGRLLLAGDEFQDLDAAGDNEMIAWARSAAETISLSQIHRTSVQGLLDAAAALREGGKVGVGPGFELVSVPVFQLGAWQAANFIRKGARGESLALLTPVSASRSPFAHGLVERLGSGPLGKAPRQIGAYRIPWERSDDDQCAELLERLGLAERGEDDVVAAGEVPLRDSGTERMVRGWLDRQRRLKGVERFSVGELRDRVQAAIQKCRTHGTTRRSFLAMTVHQAKNQEFDNVVVLWPYEAAGSDLRRRRLLYNAVTRARRRAIVIVQNNPAKNDRLKGAPFASVS